MKKENQKRYLCSTKGMVAKARAQYKYWGKKLLELISVRINELELNRRYNCCGLDREDEQELLRLVEEKEKF